MQQLGCLKSARETCSIVARNDALRNQAFPRYLEVSRHMTKAELIDAIATAADVTKADAEKTVNAFFDIVVK